MVDGTASACLPLFSLVARVLQLTTTKCCVGGSVDVEGLFLGSVLQCLWQSQTM